MNETGPDTAEKTVIIVVRRVSVNRVTERRLQTVDSIDSKSPPNLIDSPVHTLLRRLEDKPEIKQRNLEGSKT